MSYDLRRKWLRFVGAGVATLLLLGTSSSALAAETHVFNATLSLTGDCSTSELDPVPDPGLCPMPPGVAGVDHPAAPFSNPRAVATDFYGNIYVASTGPEASLGTKGKIVIFDSSGHFISEIVDESGPGALAIDSEGNLYVANAFSALEESLVRYTPTSPYDPATGEISYEDPPVVIKKKEGFGGLAINPADDRLFLKRNNLVIEYKSAADGSPTEANEELETIGEGKLAGDSMGIAVDAEHGRLYASTWQGPENERAIRVFELAAPHNLLYTIEGADVPGGEIESSFLSLAADESSGHLYLYEGEATPPRVYEFETSASSVTYLSTIEHGFKHTFLSQIAVDNGEHSPNGALSSERYLYVPSNTSGVGHSYAFGPSGIGKPVVESTSVPNVGETEAELEAAIEPFGLKTHYVFEYLTKQAYVEAGETFIGAGAPVAGEGEIPAGNSPIAVAAAAEGLSPGTAYRFRVFAENAEGSGEAEAEFATYPAAEPFPLCANDSLRSGFSALLPDCRAYELVTPPDTNARTPVGVVTLGTFFPTREASPSGGAVSFQIEGGIIPGSEGSGAFAGDPYLATRDESGWSTANAGPNGAEAAAPTPGSTSPDQGYSFWSSGPLGPAAIEGQNTTYIRYPDGHSALIGLGSIATNLRALGKLISEGGSHVIFTSGGGSLAIQLEPNAPPNGTVAIYDRTADEVTHVVSLLPGDVTPAAGEDATYQGASLDGAGVAFKIGSTLYLRVDNEETYELGEGVTFAGVAEGGERAFYLEGGRLWRFDAATGKRTAFSSGTVTPVNVSADGSTAYFVSSKVLAAGPNPNGAEPVNGAENLYRSKGGNLSFVGTVTAKDMVAEVNPSKKPTKGLSLWTLVVGSGELGGELGADPSRTTPDGNALLFESRAALDGYDPEGKAEVYRYDFAANELDCLSCSPTLVPASGDASLQSVSHGLGEPEPFSAFAYVTNLRADGRRAFFQSPDALVPGDVDGLQDVYEWEAQGVGSCERAGGCVYLISSGHSLRTDYLYAASDTGDDVFLRTSDILLPRDAEETPSIYDARVGGGFAEPVEEECQGEGCRPVVSPAPPLELPAQPSLGANDNVAPTKGCPKGKHKVRRGGKTVCAKKKHHKKHHKGKAGTKRGAGK